MQDHGEIETVRLVLCLLELWKCCKSIVSLHSEQSLVHWWLCLCSLELEKMLHEVSNLLQNYLKALSLVRWSYWFVLWISNFRDAWLSASLAVLVSGAVECLGLFVSRSLILRLWFVFLLLLVHFLSDFSGFVGVRRWLVVFWGLD